jgi:hypothetical protein
LVVVCDVMRVRCRTVKSDVDALMVMGALHEGWHMSNGLTTVRRRVVWRSGEGQPVIRSGIG